MRASRAAVLASAALAACTPDVPSGAYLCGPERLCPEDQLCDGATDLCVLPELAKPFACRTAAADDPPGDDTPATAAPLAGLGCPSASVERGGCLDRGDGVDFLRLEVPADCAGARLEAMVTFPAAYEAVDLLLTAGGPTPPEPVGAACATSVAVAPGQEVRCASQPVEAGAVYALGVVRTGAGDCGGLCPHNRYRLRLRLER